MAALFITSSKAGSGKTTICAGLGGHLIEGGKKVGYLKPLTASATPDTDAAFMNDALGLGEALDRISVAGTPDEVKAAYAGISASRDVVLIEGEKLDADAARIVQMLDAQVIGVESYGDVALEVYRMFDQRLLGLVVNKVPKSQLEKARQELADKLGKAGIAMLGILPEDRSLLALTVGELARSVSGQVVDSDKQPELVENIMLGAMAVDPGPDYFSRKTNKAVVLRSGRPDMQLAALETSTRCLVLTGETAPSSIVLRKARAKKVPLILTRGDISTVVGKIEEALASARFDQEKKLPRLAEVMKQGFDFSAVYQGLGIR